MKEHRMALWRVLVDVSDSEFYARILNPCDSDVILYKGTHIGSFVPISQLKALTADDNPGNMYQVENRLTRDDI